MSNTNTNIPFWGSNTQSACASIPQQDMIFMCMQMMMQMMQGQAPQMMMNLFQQVQQYFMQCQSSTMAPANTPDSQHQKKEKNNTKDDGEDLLTVRQVKNLLQVNEVTLWRMYKDGRLPRLKIGGTMLRYRKKDVDNYINSRNGDI